VTTRTTQGAAEAILAAAHELFAERGVNAVSLREITRAAGQRNGTALQYHFGDRAGLITAIIDRHSRDLGMLRNALLDDCEIRGVTDIRPLAAALVQPLVAKLSDPNGGRAFLRIVAELINSGASPVEGEARSGIPSSVFSDPDDSLARWSRLVTPLMPAEARGAPLHRRFAAVRLAHTECGRRAKEDPAKNHSLFSSALTDLVAAVLSAPVSEETTRLLDRRRSRS
jgi:AcrR family transcriptional regulator